MHFFPILVHTVLVVCANPLFAKPGAFITKETQAKQTWQRVRLVGTDAAKVCKTFGFDLSSAKPGATFNTENITCFVTDEGPGFGFLAGPKGQIAHLESFGYQ